MSGWQFLIDGVGNRDMRTISLLDTISGAKKFEIMLRDVTNMNTFKHFDDVEIWAPATNPPGGLIFDGANDYIKLANTITVDSDDWAISWWMKRSAHRYEILFSHGETTSSGFIDIDFVNNNIRIRSETNGTWTVTLDTGIDTSDGEWHHYVLNFSSVATDLYVDNTLVDTGTTNTDVADFRIYYFGRKYWHDIDESFTGSMSDVIILDESIGTVEINNLYNGKHINTTIRKAYYTLSQSSVGIGAIYDRQEFSHGTSYHGVSTGALTLDTSPLDQFIAFKGRIESMLPDYDTDTLVLVGRDYIGELLTAACVESYTTELRSYIVNDILLKYGTSMSRFHIDGSPAGDTLSYLFKTSAWDAVVKCGKEDNYRFWVDNDKDFHYHAKGYKDSGITLEVGVDDILNYNINEMGSEVINRVTVYGKETAGTQVVVMVEDLDSQGYYDVIHEKRIIDLSIETEADAIVFADKYLNEHSYVLEIIEVDLIGNNTLTAGELITLIIPDLNISGSYLIVEKQLMYPNGVTKIKVAKYAKNLEGLISDMVEKLLMLERFFMEESSVVTKIHRVYENVLHTDRIVLDKRASNDSFKLGVKNWCNIGVTKLGGRGANWTNVYDSGW